MVAAAPAAAQARQHLSGLQTPPERGRLETAHTVGSGARQDEGGNFMTFILLTCAPMLAAVLLLSCKPRTSRHRKPCAQTPPTSLVHCPPATPLLLTTL